MATIQQTPISETEKDSSEENFLDDNHPLVQRFQQSLSHHLLKHEEKLKFDLLEIRKALNEKTKEREDVGARLYEVQREIARQKKTTEVLGVQYAKLAENRPTMENELEISKNSLDQLHKEYNGQIAQDAAIISKVDTLNCHVNELTLVKDKLQSDIVTLRQGTNKVTSEKVRLQADKEKQDINFNRKNRIIQNLQETLGLYEAQISLIEGDILPIHTTTINAKIEIEALSSEGRQLLKQWNDSVNSLRNRDETLSAFRHVLVKLKENIKVTENEATCIEHSINKEEEVSHKLSSVCSCLHNDVALINKRLASNLANMETAKVDADNARENLEVVQGRITAEKKVKARMEADLNDFKKIAKAKKSEKSNLQQTFDERLLNSKCKNSYIHNIIKDMEELQITIKHLESQKLKNKSALTKINCEELKHRDCVLYNENQVRTIQAEVDRNEEEHRSDELKLKQLQTLVIKKREQIDLMKKKLERLTNDNKGSELGPLDNELLQTNRTLEHTNLEIFEIQGLWLKRQAHLVNASEKKDKLYEQHRHLQRQLNVYMTHRLQLEEEIERVEHLNRTLRRSINNLRNGLATLNGQAYERHTQEEQLHWVTILTEEEIVNMMSDRERELISLRDHIERIRDNEENLNQELFEAKNLMLIWQQKLQLSNEIKLATDKEYKSSGEICSLQTNLHRMRVRYTELGKRQGGLVHGMEQAVRCWDNLLTKGEFQIMTETSCRKLIENNQNSEVKRHIGDTRQKLQFLIKEITSLKSSNRDLQDKRQEINRQITSGKARLERQLKFLDESSRMLQDKMCERCKIVETLLILQNIARYYRNAHDAKYQFLYERNASTNQPVDIDNETQKHRERSKLIIQVISDLENDLEIKFRFFLDSVKAILNVEVDLP